MKSISDLRAAKALVHVVAQKYDSKYLAKYGIYINQQSGNSTLNITLENQEIMRNLCHNLLYGSNDNPYWLFHDIIERNDQSLLRLLLYAVPREYKPAMLKSNSFKAFVTAAKNSSTAVLDILLPELLGQEDCDMVFKLLLQHPELSASIKAYVKRTKDSMGMDDESDISKAEKVKNKPKKKTRKKAFILESFLNESLRIDIKPKL